MVAQLDTKTVYSFMDSLMTLDKYIATAKTMGYKQLGIMDKNNLYAAYTFLEKAKKAGLQPLLGIELDVIFEEQPLSLRLLTLSTKGYQQLMKIATQKMLGKSRWEDLSPLIKDLAIIIPAFEGVDDLELGHDFYIGVSPRTKKQDFKH